MEYIKMNPCFYKLLLKDENKKLDLFKAVFNSFLFFKTFLTKEATDVMPETDKDILKGISESWKRQLHQINNDLTSEDLYNAAEDLYNDILLQNGYKDSSNGDNLKLNHLLMTYIKLRHYIYEHLCSNENNDVQKSDFFKKVFESFFFFKKFLINID